jgi:phosphoribosyl-AMP cyclohydrolase
MKNKDLEETLKLKINFDKDGLVPVTVQIVGSEQILMLAYANKNAINRTLKTGYATFWSRSRQKLWTKGEESGNYLRIEEVLVDCDQDALVYRVYMDGWGACHTKNQKGLPRKTCFYRRVLNGKTLEYLEEYR